VQQGRHQVPLAVILRKAVQQQHRRAADRPVGEDVEGQPVALHPHVLAHRADCPVKPRRRPIEATA
jgi:hypothetical protein